MRTLSSKLFSFFAFLLAFTMIACSGGGGGSTPPPAPAPTYTITGNAGVASAAMRLTGTSVANVTADANGKYTFANLANGSYTVAPSLAGYTFSPASAAVAVNGANVANVNFTATIVPPLTYSVSGTVSGSVQGGVTITLNPGNVTTVTKADGTYVLSGIPDGPYVITPSLAGYTFTPSSTSVTVADANVANVNFTAPIPVLATGKLLYSGAAGTGLYGLNVWDLALGRMTGFVTVYSTSSTTATVVSSHTGNKLAYRAGDGTSIYTFIPNVSTTYLVQTGGTEAPGYSTTTYGSFDVSSAWDYAVVTLANQQGNKDIFIILTDGSYRYLQLTTDGVNSSPAIITSTDHNSALSVLYLKNGNEIWKQDVGAGGVISAPATLFASSVVDGVRPMSVNASYTQLAYMKNVGGVSHIVVVPLAGGAEVDLGTGTNPCWSLDGSNKVMYTDNNALWVINPDGTGKMSVPTPTDIVPGTLAYVVFAPPTF